MYCFYLFKPICILFQFGSMSYTPFIFYTLPLHLAQWGENGVCSKSLLIDWNNSIPSARFCHQLTESSFRDPVKCLPINLPRTGAIGSHHPASQTTHSLTWKELPHIKSSLYGFWWIALFDSFFCIKPYTWCI